VVGDDRFLNGFALSNTCLDIIHVRRLEAAMVVAKKKTKKTAKKKTTTTRSTTIRYSCSGSCKATPKNAHIGKKGSKVVLKATNTNARVTFTTSPFAKKVFNIAAGTQVTATVVKTSGSFPYALSCAACPSSAAPPEMIVP